MKKILFVFVILLMVSCSGNGVPLAEAELEDFCSRENAGKEIFIGNKVKLPGLWICHFPDCSPYCR